MFKICSQKVITSKFNAKHPQSNEKVQMFLSQYGEVPSDLK